MRRPAGRSGATLEGWWKCLPLLLSPFIAIFSEAWFHTQILRNQYDANDVNVNIRETQARVDAFLREKHHLERMERIQAKAPDLGLIPPNPGQIVNVSRERVPLPSARPPFIVAQSAIPAEAGTEGPDAGRSPSEALKAKTRRDRAVAAAHP